MSTNYFIYEFIPVADLIGGRLDKWRILLPPPASLSMGSAYRDAVVGLNVPLGITSVSASGGMVGHVSSP
jgi:hypothetical protein